MCGPAFATPSSAGEAMGKWPGSKCEMRTTAKRITLDAANKEIIASAGNRTRVTSMATMYSTTRPLMLLPMRLNVAILQLIASALASKTW